MKVMIIGAAGFIGSTAAAHMIQNTDFSIVSLDDLSGTPDVFNLEPVLASKNRHTFQVADVFDRRIMNAIIKLEKPDVILFVADSKIAGRGGKDAFAALLETVYEGNNKIGKIVCVVPDNEILDCGNHKNVIFIKTCQLFGHRQSPDSIVPTTIFRLLHNTGPVPVPRNNIQEWLYIGDFLTALVLLIKNGEPKTYYVSAGFLATEAEVINKISVAMGATPALDENCSEMKNIFYSKDIFELGWIPTRAIDEALSHTARWYQTNEWAFRGKKW